MISGVQLGRDALWSVIDAGISVRRHARSCALCRAYLKRPRQISAPCWLGRELLAGLDRAGAGSPTA